MRTTSQWSPGVRETTVPTPSTCPWTMWPPSRVAAVTARSRFTPPPTPTSPRLLRRSVSAMTSVVHTPLPSASVVTPVTVRHTPLTAIESPRDTPSRARRARMCSTALSGPSSRAARVPTSSTMPVNTSAPSSGPVRAPSVPGRPQPDLHVPAQAGDVDDLQVQRGADRRDSQVAHHVGAGAQQGRRQVHDRLVDQTGGEEGRGQGGAALEQQATDIPVEQLREPGGRVGGAADQGGGDVVEDPGGGRQPAAPVEDDAQRLP